MENLNRLKAVLADAGQTNKWLAEQLGKDPVTISKWCTNTTQPDLQLNAYTAAYGEMHQIKCRAAFQNFPFDQLQRTT